MLEDELLLEDGLLIEDEMLLDDPMITFAQVAPDFGGWPNRRTRLTQVRSMRFGCLACPHARWVAR